MFEEDKLFFFMGCLKEWDRTELNRRQVQTIPAATTAAECQTDYAEPSKKNILKNNPVKSVGRNKNYLP